jgi:hypothetical protein
MPDAGSLCNDMPDAGSLCCVLFSLPKGRSHIFEQLQQARIALPAVTVSLIDRMDAA